ncbi:maltokinase N-terminal cap-like domain-containing protein [Curtobacterium sp. RRHDQ10]|uniref:maltokinase N-terminal cap-like domain-containing protein n=1 Tax=Curtobacterium phyllosphaerae TaxID=3413379 RepID=UPI003BF4362D
MALLHRSTIVPGKLELAAPWLATQPWWPGGSATALVKRGAFRLDDPDGQVGIEVMLVATADGALLVVPLTYRDAPLVGAEAGLLGTMEHSVLGTRWTYDAAVDPVALTALAETVRTEGAAAREMVDGPDGPAEREPSVRARGVVRPGGAVPVVGIGAASEVVTSSDAVATTIVVPGASFVLRRSLDAAWTPDVAPGLLAVSWGTAADVPILAVSAV